MGALPPKKGRGMRFFAFFLSRACARIYASKILFLLYAKSI